MGFYGNLYTNLTTFFHNVWFKGSKEEKFLADAEILTTSTTAQPVVAYDGLNINSGNRWIQFKSEADTIDNGAGDTNSAGIAIYHAPPSGVDPTKVSEQKSEISRSPLTSEITVNPINNLDEGGYLTTYIAEYDKAGHLKSLKEKIFKFSDIKTVRELAEKNKSDLVQLTDKYNTIQPIVAEHTNTLNGLTDPKTGTIPILAAKVLEVEGAANEAKTVASGLEEKINKANQSAENAVTTANKASQTADAAKTAAEQASGSVSTFTDVMSSHQNYFDAIKNALIIIAGTDAMSDVENDLNQLIDKIRPPKETS